MVEARRGLGLPPEPGHERLVPRVVGGEDLHGDDPTEHAVPTPVHAGHPALAERLLELVAPAQDDRLLAQSPSPCFWWPFPCPGWWPGGVNSEGCGCGENSGGAGDTARR